VNLLFDAAAASAAATIEDLVMADQMADSLRLDNYPLGCPMPYTPGAAPADAAAKSTETEAAAAASASSATATVAPGCISWGI
jgi:hypothetical protein